MQKLTILLAFLALCAGLWAENSVITFESSLKMYPADLNELIQNYEDGDGSKWAQFIRDYPEFEIFDEDGPSEVSTFVYNFFNPKCFLDANGQVLGFTYEYDGRFGTITFDGELATILGDDSLQLYAFKDCNNLRGITLPEGLTTIGNKAFNNAYIFGVTIPASVTTIGESAFEGCPIQNITIPASVTTIGESAFANCPIQNITVQWTEAASIPTPSDGAFANIASPATVHVPAHTRELYMNTAWSQIGTLEDPAYVSYIDENGEEQAVDAVLLSGHKYEPDTLGVEGQITWYAVKDIWSFEEGIICHGDVRLILFDGALVFATGIDDDENDIHTTGIQVSSFRDSLTIYGQAEQTGKLIAKGGKHSAGIGGGYRTAAIIGRYTENGSNITINGGIIEAIGGTSAAGIGGGNEGEGYNITINGGVVTANGGGGAAGIGGGYKGEGISITINGGVVTANGGGGGAGIGGGYYSAPVCNGHEITINGGIVTANGGDQASGIGNGYSFAPVHADAYNIYISDAYVLYAGANENNLQLITHSSATDLGSILTQQYVKIEGLATPYTLTVTDGQWGTVCLPYAATSFSGADFYKVNYYDENESKLYIEPVTTLEAGMPYIYEATDTSMLTINHDAITPMAYNAAGNENGFFGSFARQAFTSTNDFPHAYISEGAVIIAPAASQVIVPACHTYLYMNDVPRTEQPHSAPLRIMGEPRGPVTGDMQINAIDRNNGKYIRDGQFVIIREGKIYNALGQIISNQ